MAVEDQNRAIWFIAVLAAGTMFLLWAFSAHGGITRRVSREMNWSDNQEPVPPYSPERRLATLPGSAVRLRFVVAPNTYVVADYPGLLPFLHKLNKKEVLVEFDVACPVWGGTPSRFNIASIAGLNLENMASNSGWVEGLGQDRDPLSGACDWW